MSNAAKYGLLAASVALSLGALTACLRAEVSQGADSEPSLHSSEMVVQGPAIATAETSIQQKNAEAFLRELLARDEKALYAYDGGNGAFFISGKLRPEISDFLYGSHAGWRSVTEIAAEGKLETIVVPHGDGVVTVIYVPSAYKAAVKDLEFLQSEWMKKYFACQFITRDPQWKLLENFCFSETDGPYPPDIG